MKLAVTGKGGVGKSALTAMLAIAFGEAGLPVLVVDLDANPGLALSLGIPADDVPLPSDAVQEHPGLPYGWGLADELDAEEAVRRYATPVSDRIRFIGLGNITGIDKAVKRYVTALRRIVDEVDGRDQVVIADLEAGPTTPFEGYARFAEPWLVVCEATPASMLAARRILTIAADADATALVVANKVAGPGDVGTIERGVAAVAAAIPDDPQVRSCERAGSLLGLAPECPARVAVRELAMLLSTVSSSVAYS